MLKDIYRTAKSEYRDIVKRFDSREENIVDTAMKLTGIIRYATDMYIHTFAVSGIFGVDVYNDKKFAKLLNTIKNKIDNLNDELMQEQIKFGEKDNWKDNKENDACLNHLTETFGSKKQFNFKGNTSALKRVVNASD